MLQYELVDETSWIILENERWTIAVRHNPNADRYREIIIAVESAKGRTVIFDRDSGLLLSSFDVSFDSCYSLKLAIARFFR